ncbi:MAG: tetratricopeptide repeat protein, partial [Pseudomonadota bacterium]
PYFWELKGQVLYENGRATDAVGAYERSVALAPNSALIRIGLARAYLEQGTDADRTKARDALKEAVRLEETNSGAWRLLGIAEGQLGNANEADLALAEHAVLTRNKRDARLYLSRVEPRMNEGDAGWFRLQDLKRMAAEIDDPPRR